MHRLLLLTCMSRGRLIVVDESYSFGTVRLWRYSWKVDTCAHYMYIIECTWCHHIIYVNVCAHLCPHTSMASATLCRPDQSAGVVLCIWAFDSEDRAKVFMKVFVDDKEHQIVRYCGQKWHQSRTVQPYPNHAVVVALPTLSFPCKSDLALVRSGIVATFAVTTAFILPYKIPSCSRCTVNQWDQWDQWDQWHWVGPVGPVGRAEAEVTARCQQHKGFEALDMNLMQMDQARLLNSIYFDIFFIINKIKILLI